MNENHSPESGKDEIRLARQIRSMEAEAEAHRMNEASHDELGSRVLRTDRAHAAAGLFACVDVGQMMYARRGTARASHRRRPMKHGLETAVNAFVHENATHEIARIRLTGTVLKHRGETVPVSASPLDCISSRTAVFGSCRAHVRCSTTRLELGRQG